MSKFKISLLIKNLDDAKAAVQFKDDIIPAVSAALIQKDETKYQPIIQTLTKNFPLVSIALGDGGNENNWKLVLEYAKKYQLKHVNMPLDKYHLAKQYLGPLFFINALVKMTDKPNVINLANQNIAVQDLPKYIDLEALESLKCLDFAAPAALTTFAEIIKLSHKHQLLVEPAKAISEKTFADLIKVFAKYDGFQIVPHIFSPFFTKDQTIDWALVKKYLAVGKEIVNE